MSKQQRIFSKLLLVKALLFKEKVIWEKSSFHDKILLLRKSCNKTEIQQLF